jgi:hypothetical protein
MIEQFAKFLKNDCEPANAWLMLMYEAYIIIPRTFNDEEGFIEKKQILDFLYCYLFFPFGTFR